MANIIPVHKKEAKYLGKNYRPISLLPIFAKVFERFLFDSLFSHFHNNNLFTKCQSGFMPGDSCKSQLLSIIHEIQSSFDYKPPTDVRSIFLDISKVLNKVWHQGLLFKLKSYGVKGKFLRLLKNYLDNRKQRVILDGRGAYLEKLFFLAYHKVLF